MGSLQRGNKLAKLVWLLPFIAQTIALIRYTIIVESNNNPIYAISGTHTKKWIVKTENQNFSRTNK